MRHNSTLQGSCVEVVGWRGACQADKVYMTAGQSEASPCARQVAHAE